MKKILIYVFCLSVCLSLACAPFAQAADPQQQPGPPKFFAKNAKADYKKKMDVASAKLKKVEDLSNKIEKNRVFHKGDWDSMNKDLEQYARDMYNLHKEAAGRVKEASDTGGKTGGTEEFLYFEETVKGHAKRLTALDEKHKSIEGDIRNGKIKPGKDIIDTMTPREG